MMILIEEVLVRCRVNRSDLTSWIQRDWVRPATEANEWRFGEADIARIELICDLVHNLDLDTDALDIILSLLDQVYALRRSLRAMSSAVDALPADSRQKLLDRLAGANAEQPDGP